LSRWQNERELVLNTSLKLVEKGLVIGTSGNVSQRLRQDKGPDLIVITPTSRYYDSITADDIPVVSLDGSRVEDCLDPSSEVLMHIAIYKARSDVDAVIHTHSTYASTVSVSDLEIPAILEEEVMLLGGPIRVARYARSGTIELANNVVAGLEGRSAVVLANHGAVGVGRTMREALNACELLEKAAKVYLFALAAGKLNLLPTEAIAAAQAYFSSNHNL
jgi:L-fuculose-phosphate aldolase